MGTLSYPFFLPIGVLPPVTHQGPLPQDTTYPTQTPSLRGAIPILCLIVPLSTGGQTLAPTRGCGTSKLSTSG